jgi:hypothetical protein
MALATYSIVAWRLLWLTYQARLHGEESCESFLKVEKITPPISSKPEPPLRNRVAIVPINVKLTPNKNSLPLLNSQSKRLQECKDFLLSKCPHQA